MLKGEDLNLYIDKSQIDIGNCHRSGGLSDTVRQSKVRVM